ncbi:MAG: hypothetical protein KF773_26575 [Deltaproteobacteria bacterium]|nr:hypothetical protein [Deltaproteobacteria bacterium]
MQTPRLHTGFGSAQSADVRHSVATHRLSLQDWPTSHGRCSSSWIAAHWVSVTQQTPGTLSTPEQPRPTTSMKPPTATMKL